MEDRRRNGNWLSTKAKWSGFTEGSGRPKKIDRFVTKFSGEGLPHISFRIDEGAPRIKSLFLMDNGYDVGMKNLTFISNRLRSTNSPGYVWRDFEWNDWNNSQDLTPIVFDWENYNWQTIVPGTMPSWTNVPWQDVTPGITNNPPQNAPGGPGWTPIEAEWSNPASPGRDWGGNDLTSYNPPRLNSVSPPDWIPTDFNSPQRNAINPPSGNSWAPIDNGGNTPWNNTGTPGRNSWRPIDNAGNAPWNNVQIPVFNQISPPASGNPTTYVFEGNPPIEAIAPGPGVATDAIPPDAPALEGDEVGNGYVAIYCDPAWVLGSGGNVITFTVTIFEARTVPTYVQVAIGGTARVGTDYSLSGINEEKIISLAAGEISKEFVVTPIAQEGEEERAVTVIATISGSGQNFPRVLEDTATGTIVQVLEEERPELDGEVVTEHPPGSYIPFFVIEAEPTRMRVEGEDESIVFTVRMVDLDGEELAITGTVLCYLSITGTAVEGTHYTFTDKVTGVGNAASNTVGDGGAILEFKRGETAKVLTAVPVAGVEIDEPLSIVVSILPQSGFTEERNPFIDAGLDIPYWLEETGSATGWVVRDAITAGMLIDSPYTPPADNPYPGTIQINYGNPVPVSLLVGVELDESIELIPEFELEVRVSGTAVRREQYFNPNTAQQFNNELTADYFIEPVGTDEYDTRLFSTVVDGSETSGWKRWVYKFHPGMFALMTELENRIHILEIPIYVNLAKELTEAEQAEGAEPKYLAIKPIAQDPVDGQLPVFWLDDSTKLLLFVQTAEEDGCIFKVLLPGGKVQGFYADEDLELSGYQPLAISVQSIDDYSALLYKDNSYAFVKNGTVVIKELNGYVCPLGTELVLQVEKQVGGAPGFGNNEETLPDQLVGSITQAMPTLSAMWSSLLYQVPTPWISTNFRVVSADSEREFSTDYLVVTGGAKRLRTILPWIKDTGLAESGNNFRYISDFINGGWEVYHSVDQYNGREGCCIYTHVVVKDRRDSFHKEGDAIDKLRINVEIGDDTYKITESLENTEEHFYAIGTSVNALVEGVNEVEIIAEDLPSASMWATQPGRFYSVVDLAQPNWLEISSYFVHFGISNCGLLSNIPGEYDAATPELISNKRNEYLDPPTDVYVYEIKNGMAKRWDGVISGWTFATRTNTNFRILVDEIRQPTLCLVELSNPQEPEFYAWGNFYPDSVVIEPKSNSTLSITDYSFNPSANTNIYLQDVQEGEDSYQTMEIAVGQKIPGAQDEKEEWLADRYRFNIDALKWERLPNMKGKLSPITEESIYVAPYPKPDTEEEEEENP